ncbi:MULTISPECIES: hypothetical protein [Pseudomonas]|uniref:hypothetical protein n=1 Tax=Pseudomonas TaxID=286 RepID=UPI001BEB7F5A|nr:MULTISPECIES: hypothetical protein [Pseudomonas]MBT2339530.1 hypothetical protein [Pseudomonas fluorescens]MCD4528694.1 hypothetical protein [Pseudomonas sp. C3-2018]
MSKRYEVLERSFINGRLYEPGETVVLEIDSPGGNLKPATGKAVAAPVSSSNDAAFIAVRGAAGKFVIKDAEGNRVGAFAGTKAEAEAEAERLISGGDIAPAKEAQDDLPDA